MFIPDYITKKEIERALENEDLINKMIEIMKIIIDFDITKNNYINKAIEQLAKTEEEKRSLKYIFEFCEYYNRHLKYRIYLSNVKAEEEIQKMYYEAMNEIIKEIEKNNDKEEEIDKNKLN